MADADGGRGWCGKVSVDDGRLAIPLTEVFKRMDGCLFMVHAGLKKCSGV